MHHVIGALVVGGLAGGLAGRSTGPRSVLRSLVKGGIVTKRKLEAVGQTAKVEMQKLVDEARADLDRAGTEQPS
jgi:hypothetical protein